GRVVGGPEVAGRVADFGGDVAGGAGGEIAGGAGDREVIRRAWDDRERRRVVRERAGVGGERDRAGGDRGDGVGGQEVAGRVADFGGDVAGGAGGEIACGAGDREVIRRAWDDRERR